MTSLVRLAACLAAGVWLAALPGLAQPGPGEPVADPAYHPLNGKRPNAQVEFPAISDWSTLRIRLERSACFGTCPVYSVEIAGDGTVIFEGERYVAVKGVQKARISRKAVRSLYDAFVKADFFWTYDSYEAPITDFPTHIVSISFDTRSKAVVDYAGERAGLPKAVAELEEAIDAAAGTDRWIIGHRP